MSNPTTAASWTYCSCVGTHAPDCLNGVPGGFPPLTDDDNQEGNAR